MISNQQYLTVQKYVIEKNNLWVFKRKECIIRTKIRKNVYKTE